MEQRITALQIEDLSVAYEGLAVLWHITADIPQGSIVGVLGPNGAGKSTLLKAAMGLIRPISGRVSTHGKKIAYVPQRNTVDWDFPITVSEVVAMGAFARRGVFGRIKPEDKNKIDKAMQDLGLLSLAHRQISELSGGQQQKVFLARALVQEADIYLMDEPFAGVDLATEKAIIEMLRSLKKQGKTLVLVHHDLYSVEEYFDWILLLNKTLVAQGVTQEVFSQEHLHLAYGEHLPFFASKR